MLIDQAVKRACKKCASDAEAGSSGDDEGRFYRGRRRKRGNKRTGRQQNDEDDVDENGEGQAGIPLRLIEQMESEIGRKGGFADVASATLMAAVRGELPLSLSSPAGHDQSVASNSDSNLVSGEKSGDGSDISSGRVGGGVGATSDQHRTQATYSTQMRANAGTSPQWHETMVMRLPKQRRHGQRAGFIEVAVLDQEPEDLRVAAAVTQQEPKAVLVVGTCLQGQEAGGEQV
jgi:hypothetical protein